MSHESQEEALDCVNSAWWVAEAAEARCKRMEEGVARVARELGEKQVEELVSVCKSVRMLAEQIREEARRLTSAVGGCVSGPDAPLPPTEER